MKVPRGANVRFCCNIFDVGTWEARTSKAIRSGFESRPFYE
jgi:hypothetical protein